MRMNQFLAASALLLCFACAKNEIVDNQDRIENVSSAVQEQNDEPGQQPEEEGDGSVVMTFGARIAEPEEYIQPAVEPDPAETGDEGDGETEEGDEGTKTHLGTLADGKYPNYWSVGDKVKINSDESAPLGEEYATPSKSARFPMVKWVEKYEGYYHVGYPAEAFAFSEGVGTVTLSSEQTYVEGSYDPEAFVLIGKSEEEELAFIPVMGLLRVTAKNADGVGYGSKIASVTLQSIGGEALSGTFTTDYTNGSTDLFKASAGVSSVTINAPTDAGLDFGTQFFFCVPAGDYNSGLRFIVTTLDGKSMVFSNPNPYTVYVGAASNIGSPKYEPSPTSLPKPTLWEITSSTLCVEWISHIPVNDYGKRWRIVVSTDAGFQDVVRDYIIPAKADCWSKNQTPLRFSVGRLNPGGTYYVKVVDVGNNIESEVSLPLQMSDFTVVPMPAAITGTGVKFAENFGEVGWGSCLYNGIDVGGFYPVTNAGGDSVGQKPFTTLTTGAQYTAYHNGDVDWHFRYARFNTAYDESRLKNWYYSHDVYFKNGYIKLGRAKTKDNPDNTGYLLTPAIPLADGKAARVDVSVRVSKYTAASTNTWAVFVVSDATVETPGKTPAGRLATYTWPSTSDPTLYQEFTVTSTEWETKTISGLYVTNGDRIVIGLASGGPITDGVGRLNVDAVSIDVKEITDDFIIRDAETLGAFKTLIAGAESAAVKGTNARVVKDVDASSLTWTPIAGYTGTFKGGDKEIAGLDKPLFDDLQGTVQNLTLDSDVVETTQPNVGIFARTLAASSASSGLYNCTAKSGSSVTGTYTAAFTANACIGGLVGSISQGGTLNNCVNNATISITNTTATSAYDIFVGGVAGYTIPALSDDTVTAAVTLTDCVNHGNVTNGASTTTNGVRMCIGGTFGLTVASNLTRCANTAEVRNDGTSGKTTSVGGLCGSILQTSGNPSVLSACYNTGAVKNYGLATDGSNLTLRLGGLVGWVDQQNTLAGTSSSDCNYNNGPVTDYSGSSRPAIGGICGYVNNAGTTLDYCENRPNGVITTSYADKTIGYQVYVGGVIGYCNDAIALSHLSNAANINMTTTTTVNRGVVVGGVVGYLNSASASSRDISNTGSITVSNLTCRDFYVGGLMGYNKGSISGNCSNGATGDLSVYVNATGYTLYAGGLYGKSEGAITGTSGQRIVNNGDVTILSGSTADQCTIAGVVGCLTASASYCTNYGVISNSATGNNIRVGGVIGYGKNSSLSYCSNLTGGISNTADAENVVCVGGVIGYSLRDAGSVSIANCYNTGAVSNSGTGEGDSLDFEVAVGGLAGYLDGSHNLGGTALANNYNNGPVTEQSGTDNVAVGGVVGVTNDTATSLKYARNLANGDICVKEANSDQFKIGGVLGLGVVTADVDYASNAGDIVLKDLMANQVWVGGVIGQWSDGNPATTHTIQHCSNSGKISTDDTDCNDVVAKGTDISYFGGIVGGAPSGHKNRVYTYCKNTGDIVIYDKARSRIGGIAATCTAPISHCEVKADITHKRKSNEGGSTSLSQVGGLVGYAGSDGADATYESLLYAGTMDVLVITDGMNGYACGIIGVSDRSKTITFSHCYVGGSIKGRNASVSGGTPSAPRLFSCNTDTINDANKIYQFSGCGVCTGTFLKASAEYTFTSADQITPNNHCFSKFANLHSDGLKPAVMSQADFDAVDVLQE